MIEIVFSDSAHGSLKVAQNYGEGPYHNGPVGILVNRSQGKQADQKEIEKARQEAQRQFQAEWEAAVPLGGKAADVYGFSFAWSIGDISEDIPGEKRGQVLEGLYGIYPEANIGIDIGEWIHRGKRELETICSRLSNGESVRVWYSNQPDELCGMHWFMAQIEHLIPSMGQVSLVALPDDEIYGDGSYRLHTGWGNIGAGDWHRYLDLQRTATPSFCKGCAAHWRQLQQENACLRAVLNGRLVSMPETLYDDWIIREIQEEETTFHEARLFGRILGKYALGIGDAWIALRIEQMISRGFLVPVTEPGPEAPVYHRFLRKCGEEG